MQLVTKNLSTSTDHFQMTTYVHSTTACFYHLRTVIVYQVIKTGPVSLALAILTCVQHANLFSWWHKMLKAILTFTHRSPKWSHSYRFTIWIFLCISYSHIHTTLISHDIFLQFISANWKNDETEMKLVSLNLVPSDTSFKYTLFY
jgi:hypothetical protein